MQSLSLPPALGIESLNSFALGYQGQFDMFRLLQQLGHRLTVLDADDLLDNPGRLLRSLNFFHSPFARICRCIKLKNKSQSLFLTWFCFFLLLLLLLFFSGIMHTAQTVMDLKF